MEEKKDENVEKMEPTYPFRNECFDKLKKKILSLGLSRNFFQDNLQKIPCWNYFGSKKIKKQSK